MAEEACGFEELGLGGWWRLRQAWQAWRGRRAVYAPHGIAGATFPTAPAHATAPHHIPPCDADTRAWYNRAFLPVFAPYDSRDLFGWVPVGVGRCRRGARSASSLGGLGTPLRALPQFGLSHGHPRAPLSREDVAPTPEKALLEAHELPAAPAPAAPAAQAPLPLPSAVSGGAKERRHLRRPLGQLAANRSGPSGSLLR